MVKTTVKKVIKYEKFGAVELYHVIFHLIGWTLLYQCWYEDLFKSLNLIQGVIALIVYLGLLFGIAPIVLGIPKTKWMIPFVSGLSSGFLDSFLVLLAIKKRKLDEMSTTTKIIFYTLNTIAAIIGGMWLWFGEAFAVPQFMHEHRTGFFAAIFIWPVILVFLTILGFLMNRLDITIPEIDEDEARPTKTRDKIEFAAGVILLLTTHDPLLCLGALLVYSTATGQSEHLFDAWKHETEYSIMGVLIICLLLGPDLVEAAKNLGLFGEFTSLIPSGIQAVLWGAVYHDPDVHFWIRVTNISTGALLTPISSLVGVIMFNTRAGWAIYMRYSIPLALVWYLLMRGWIWLTYDTWFWKLCEEISVNGILSVL